MKVNDLLSPGLLANGIKLRVEAAKAISHVQIVAGRTLGGKYPGAATLSAFFTDCASQLSALIDAVLPELSTQTATSSVLVTLVFSEDMDQTVTPAVSSMAISGGAEITSMAWASATTLELTGTGFAAAQTFDYTAPATSYLRDLAGNAVADITGAVLA
jgi:hypothetical protein